jgi:hypothetical protein
MGAAAAGKADLVLRFKQVIESLPPIRSCPDLIRAATRLLPGCPRIKKLWGERRAQASSSLCNRRSAPCRNRMT